mgnify:FL=1
MRSLNMIIRKLWLIVLLPLAASGTAYYISAFLLTPEYEADVRLYVYQSGAEEFVNSDTMITLQYLIKDYGELIKSRAVITSVINNLDLSDADPEALAESISVDLKNGTNMIEIKVRDRSPETAAGIANEISAVFIEEVNRLTGLKNVSILDPAVIPEEPVSPDIVINTLAACLAGMLIALGIVFLLDRFDDSIMNEQDVQKYVNLGVVGVIPKYSHHSGKGAAGHGQIRV